MNEKEKPADRLDDQQVIAKKDLGHEIESQIGQEKFKAIGQDLAMVVAKHDLTKAPILCRKIFDYMCFVIQGWNSV